MSFAKLYETDIGQVLVKLDSAESEEHDAEVRIYFEPKGLGVCSAAFSYDDWDKAEEAFDKVDQDMATAIARDLMDKFGGFAK